MSTFLYTRPTDRLLGDLRLEMGTAAPGYPIANLDDGMPDKPSMLTTTTGAWVRDVGLAVQCDVCALIHHNLRPGIEVRLQGNDTDDWTAPAVNEVFTVPPPHVDKFGINVWMDLATLVPHPPYRTMQFWRLAVIGTNDAPIAIGEWVMYSNLRNLGIRNIKWGSERGWTNPTIIHETDFLVRRAYSMQTVVRNLRVDIDPVNTILDEVDEWRRSSYGPAVPFLIVPHREETDAWFVSFLEPEQSYTRERRDYNTGQLQFQEMSRGLWI